MLSDFGVKVIAADLDPQATLSAMFLDEDKLGLVWWTAARQTVYGAVSSQLPGGDAISPSCMTAIDDNIGLLVGDLRLSSLEQALSDAWPRCADGDERSLKMMSGVARAIGNSGTQFMADVALIDLGPNLGALNRAALLACDFVIVPLGADLFSPHALRIMGPTLRSWRDTWKEARTKNPDPTIALPTGDMAPAGYVVMRHSVQAGRPVQALGHWMARIPAAYHYDVLDEDSPVPDRVEDDPHCLAVLKDYRSLMLLAQEARKPMFKLRPADGAFGGHQKAVQECGADFRRLAGRIMAACGVALPDKS
jgi:cellulose biosynthesis protein BcsQ